ncbi:MAG: hypothetical protein WBP81_22770 [Solirubrobacteraceae bacterium]
MGERRAAGYSTWLSARSVALPLGYLRELGVVPSVSRAVVEDPLERLLDDYRRYLFDEHGVTEHTVFGRYEPTARVLLSGRLVTRDVEMLDLRAFCVGRRIRSLVVVPTGCARHARSAGDTPRVSSWYDRSYAVATASATNAAIAAVNSRLLSSQA